MTAHRSPRTAAISWGRMTVDGMDFKLYPGVGLDRDGATTVVLSRGMELQLRVDQATLDLLAERGITVRVDETGRPSPPKRVGRPHTGRRSVSPDLSTILWTVRNQ